MAFRNLEQFQKDLAQIPLSSNATTVAQLLGAATAIKAALAKIALAYASARNQVELLSTNEDGDIVDETTPEREVIADSVAVSMWANLSNTLRDTLSLLAVTDAVSTSAGTYEKPKEVGSVGDQGPGSVSNSLPPSYNFASLSNNSITGTISPWYKRDSFSFGGAPKTLNVNPQTLQDTTYSTSCYVVRLGNIWDVGTLQLEDANPSLPIRESTSLQMIIIPSSTSTTGYVWVLAPKAESTGFVVYTGTINPQTGAQHPVELSQVAYSESLLEKFMAYYTHMLTANDLVRQKNLPVQVITEESTFSFDLASLVPEAPQSAKVAYELLDDWGYTPELSQAQKALIGVS